MHPFLFLLLLLPKLLLASGSPLNDHESAECNDTPLVATYGVPSTNILGANVITGDYHYTCVDFDLPGADPLILQRTYCSSSFQTRALWEGWSHNLSSKIAARSTSHGSYFDLNSVGTLSGEMLFRTKDKHRHLPIKVDRDVYKRGVTNCGSRELSGRTNIKNTQISFFSDAPDATDSICVKKGDGTQHWYRTAEKFLDKSLHYLTRTKKPSGAEVSYEAKGMILHQVKSLAKDDKIANQIIFSFPDDAQGIREKKKPFSIKAISDEGKTVEYAFKWHKTHSKAKDKNVLMDSFQSNCHPKEFYVYTDPKKGPEKLAELYGDQHRTRIRYYKKRDLVAVFDQQRQLVSGSHIARDRVKAIIVAVNGREDLQTAFRFSYYESKKTRKAYTDVLDEHHHLTRFHYSTKNYRLRCMEKFSDDSKIYLRERFHYGRIETPTEGDLVCRTIADGEGVIHYGEHNQYDDRGNVLVKRQLYRSLENAVPHKISLNIRREEKNWLAGGNARETRYTYNDLNLPTSENDGRVTTFFSYHSRDGSETNLPKSVLVQQGLNILKRQFYEFDCNSGCTLKIEDDGCKPELEDLSAVRCRKIQKMVNRKDSFAGLPLEIDHWGANEHEEGRLYRVVLEYDSHGNVEKEKYYDANNAFAYEQSKRYDIQGNILSETNALGETTTREFNAYGCLLKEQGPDREYCLEYVYDWLKRPVQETRRCADGVHLTIRKSYDLAGNVTKLEDPYGFTTENRYNAQGKLVETTLPPVRVGDGDWVTPRIHKEYNFLGHLISETDGNGAVTTCVPNDAGLPLEIHYPDDTTEQFLYSIYGEVIEKTHKNHSKTVYAYDSLSRVISEKTYDREGNLLKELRKHYEGSLLDYEVDGEGLKTAYTYDHAGRIATIRKEQALTKYTYDSLGRIKEERKYFGEGEQDYTATLYTYDLLGRVLVEKGLDSSGTVLSEVHKYYAENGQVKATTTLTHAGIAKTSNTYDPRGNLSSLTDAMGNTTHYHHRYDYIFEGLNLPCCEVTDPTGVRTVTVSDLSGAPVSVKVYDPQGALISHNESYYDLNGNLVRNEHHLPKETILTLYQYDSASHLIQQIRGAGSTEQLTTSFVYNSFGELIQTIYSDGSSKHHSYDGLGRLAEEWSDDQSVHYKFEYNQQDLPTAVENCITKEKTLRSYSLDGRLLSEQLENGLSIQYTYDGLGRMTQCIYPDGSSLRQTYYPKYLAKVERIKEGEVAYEVRFEEFDGLGKPKLITLPKNSGTLTVTYDLLSRPEEFEYSCYHEKEICYDQRGLQTSKIVNDALQTFEHDHLEQLTFEQTNLYSHTYENDALNRQTSVDGQTQTYNAVNQLTEGIAGHYKYDAKGRRIQDDDVQYTYDAFDRLVSVTKGASTWSYTYDAFNRKMSRTHNGETVYYLYNTLDEIGSYDENHQVIDLKVISSKEGTTPIALELNGKVYSPTVTSQGHIVGLIEIESGAMADYSPLTMFGKDLSEAPLSPWRFCGKRHEDKALGIIDFGFRFYHPQSAQWLSPDPLGESAGPNLYAYVKNSPVKHIDRYGLIMEERAPGYAYEASCEAPALSINFASTPEISFRDDFEASNRSNSIENNYGESRLFDLADDGRIEPPNEQCIVWVNGIMNNFNEAEESARYISDLSGGYNVHGVYNASHGLLRDLYECVLGLCYIATDPVHRIHETWDNHFNNTGPNSTILHISHSQGAIHTRNALLSYDKERRSRISVVAIAPAAYMYPATCQKSMHYRASLLRDGIPRIDICGARRSRKSIVTLNSAPGAALHDHAFNSPTYRIALEDQTTYYIQNGAIK